jgi:hypothetical protein
MELNDQIHGKNPSINPGIELNSLYGENCKGNLSPLFPLFKLFSFSTIMY